MRLTPCFVLPRLRFCFVWSGSRPCSFQLGLTSRAFMHALLRHLRLEPSPHVQGSGTSAVMPWRIPRKSSSQIDATRTLHRIVVAVLGVGVLDMRRCGYIVTLHGGPRSIDSGAAGPSTGILSRAARQPA
jgi:hypothetical protein